MSALALLAAMFAGLLVGQRLHASVEPRQILRAVYLLLVVSGLSLLARYGLPVA